MAKKITVQLGAELLTGQVTEVAKQYQKIIEKSTASSDQKNSAKRQMEQIESYYKRINQIISKPKIDRTDINNLNNFTSALNSSLDSLTKVAHESGVVATKEMVAIDNQMRAIREEAAKEFETINTRFRGAVSSVGAAFDLSKFDEKITQSAKKIENDERIKNQLLVERDQLNSEILNKAEQTKQVEITNAEELAAAKIKLFEQTYQIDLSQYTDIAQKKEAIEKHLADLRENLSKKAVNEQFSNDNLKKQIDEQKRLIQEAFDKGPGIGELKRKGAQDNRIAKLNLPGIGTYEEAKALMAKTEDGLKQLYARMRAEAQKNAQVQRDALPDTKIQNAQIKELIQLQQTLNELKTKESEDLITKDEAKALKDIENKIKKKEEEIEKEIHRKAVIEDSAKLELHNKAKLDEATEAQIATQQGLMDVERGQELEKRKADLDGVAEGHNGVKISLDKVSDATRVAGEENARAQTRVDTFNNSFKGLTSTIARVTSVMYLMRKGMQQLRKSMDVVSGIDKEMVQIGVVTKQTTDQLWQSFDSFNQAALNLNTTTQKYLEGARIFYQQGMDTAQVMSMVEATTRAAALSGVTFESASQTLTAAIRAYNMEASQASAVTDKFAAVGASSAANFRELSAAMERVASSAYASGMEFDSMLGILAKGIETTREAPEAIGTALKTIIARFQEMKENPMADLGEGIDANRVETALKAVGVSLRDASGEFRNLDDVFADLGQTWAGLSRNQRAYVATMAAGMRQQSRFMAIMNNYDRTLQLVRTSTNSAGEAMRQFEIYSEGVEAAQNRMKNAAEAFFVSVTSSNAIKYLYDSMEVGLRILSETNPAMLLLGTTITALTLKTVAYIVTLRINNWETGKAISSTNVFTGALLKLGIATKATTGTIITLAGAKALLTGGIVILVAIIAAVTFTLINARKKAEEAAMAIHKLASETRGMADSQRETYNSLEGQINRYEELDKKLNRTNEEQSEYIDLIKQISREAPNLVSHINAEGNAVLRRSHALSEELSIRRQLASEAEKEAFRAKLASVQSADWNATLEEGAPGSRSVDMARKIESELEKFPMINMMGQDIMHRMMDGIGEGLDPQELRQRIEDELREEFKDRAPGLSDYSVQENISLRLNGMETLYDSLENYVNTRNAEMGMLVASGLYNLGDYNLQILEFSGQKIDNATREMVAGLAKHATEAASLYDDSENRSVSEKIAVFGKSIHEGYLEVNEMLLKEDGYQEGLNHLLKLQSEGLSGDELLNAVDEFQQKFIGKFQGTKHEQAAKEMFESFSNTVFNTSTVEEDVERMGRVYQEAIGIVLKEVQLGNNLTEIGTVGSLPDTKELENELEETLMKVPQTVREMITEGVNSIETDEAKAAWIGVVNDIFATEENIDVVAKLLENTDFSNPASIQEFEDEMMKMLLATNKVTEEMAYTIVQGIMNQENVILTDFLKVAKESYAEFKAIQEDVSKAATGLDFEESLDMIEKYGAAAVTKVGEVFYLTGQAIEKARSEARQKTLSSMESAIAELNREIDDNVRLMSGVTDENSEILQKYKDQNAELEIQKRNIQEITSALMELSGADLARMANQNVLSGINAVTATAGSLQEIAVLYNQINEGSMTQLDIFNAIAKNPDYLQFLDIQNGKLAFSTELIEKETEARIEAMRTAVQERKIKVQAIIGALESYIGASEVERDLKEAAIEQAIDNLEEETIASQDSSELIQDSLMATGETVSELDKVRQEAHEAEIERINQEIAGYQALRAAMAGQDVGPITARSGRQLGSMKPPATQQTIEKGIWSQRLSDSLGVSGKNDLEIAKNSLALFNDELAKLTALEGEISTWKPNDFLNMIAPPKDGKAAKDAKDTSDAFESFIAQFDQFYNLLKRISFLQEKINRLDIRMSFNATDGKQQIKLTEEKVKLMKEEITATAELVQRRAESLDIARREMTQMFSGYVSFVGDQLEVRWDLINATKISTETEQAWLDALLNSISAYDDVKSGLDENITALLEYQAALEELMQTMLDEVIDIRQEMYNALVEGDQREVDSAKKKFDELAKLENRYLDSIRKAIAEERRLRSQSNDELDLQQKQRRLAVLERDTSGMNTLDVEKLRKEIGEDQQKMRDDIIDNQVAKLEEQIKLQQEQRDISIKMMEDQIAMRQEYGLYWQLTDQTIMNGTGAIAALLSSTDEFVRADPLKQTGLMEGFITNGQKLEELYARGLNDTDKVHDITMQEALLGGLRSVVGNLSPLSNINNQIAKLADNTSMKTAISNNAVSLGRSFREGFTGANKVVETFQAKTLSAIDGVKKDLNSALAKIASQTAAKTATTSTATSGSTSSTGGGTTPTVSQLTLDRRTLQTWLNAHRGKWGGKAISVDGSIGPATLAEMTKMYNRAMMNLNSPMASGVLSNAMQGRSLSSSALNYISNAFGTRPKTTAFKYKEGGLADYTGPAWVDGTRNNPEAFLNARQTKLFAQLRDVLELESHKLLQNNSREISQNIDIGDIIVDIKGNVTRNDANDIGKAVREEILKTFAGRVNPALNRLR